jgi:ribosome-binding factor A
MKGLKKLEGYVRGKIGSKISLRLTPEIRFVLDESFERGQKVNSILDILREERERGSSNNATKEEMMAIEDTIAERGDDEDEWLEDDEDEIFEEKETEVVIKPLRRKRN